MDKFTKTRSNGALLAVAAGLSLSATALAAVRLVPSEYATIQAAVDAAQPGDSIRIAPGDYYEQTVMTDKTNVTVAGESGAVLHAFTGMAQTLIKYVPTATGIAILGIVRSDVTVRDLGFEGHRLGDSYEGNQNGIIFRGSGGRVENCAFQEFRGVEDSRGINVFNPVMDGTRPISIEIYNCNFSDNKFSMMFHGDPDQPSLLRVSLAVERNVFTATNTYGDIDSVGIVISMGAGGNVKGNRIVNHTWYGISANDTYFANRGHFYPLRPVRFEGNTFVNNSRHLNLAGADASQVINNIFETTNPDFTNAALSVSGRNIVVENNNFSGMSKGIALMGSEKAENVEFPYAINTKLFTNWLANVSTPLEIQSGVHGLQQEGTELSRFAPLFKSIARSATNQAFSLSVRCWHGLPISLESSTNLREWKSVQTNTTPLPCFELTDSTPREANQQFYRLRGSSR